MNLYRLKNNRQTLTRTMNSRVAKRVEVIPLFYVKFTRYIFYTERVMSYINLRIFTINEREK